MASHVCKLRKGPSLEAGIPLRDVVGERGPAALVVHSACAIAS